MIRAFGGTGRFVSALSLGTVSLGADYGIMAPGEYGKPPGQDAVDLLQCAVARGITCIDTAPTYGDAERLVGLALGGRRDVLVATKVSIPVDEEGRRLTGRALHRAIFRSLESSVRLLQRDSLDLVQIHNADAELLRDGEFVSILRQARDQGLVRLIGASVYGEAAALEAISGGVDALQIAFNVLDKRMLDRVFPAAGAAGIGIMVRSPLLKGVLSAKAVFLPSQLSRLSEAASGVCGAWGIGWEQLPSMALRFCFSFPEISTVLIGARTRMELGQALAALAEGPLTPGQISAVAPYGLDDESLVDPSRWRPLDASVPDQAERVR